MRSRIAWIVVVVIVAACKKDPLGFAGPGEPFGALKQLKFGELDTEVVAHLPELSYGGGVGDTIKGVWHVDDQTDVTVRNDGITRRLKEIEVSFAGKKLDDVVKAWGPGKAGKGMLEEPAVYYQNADATIRADAQQRGSTLHVRFVPMIPLAKMFGDDPRSVAGLTLLGAKTADARKAAAAAGYSPSLSMDKLNLPTTEYGKGFTFVQCDDDDGVIRSYTVSIATDVFPSAEAEITAALEKRWGKPTPGVRFGDKVLIYRKADPQIRTSGAVSDIIAVTVDSKSSQLTE